MVVPKIATTINSISRSKLTVGKTVARTTSPQGMCTLKDRCDIEQQHQSHQLQIAGIAVIGDEYFGDEACDPEQNRKGKRRAADHQLQRFAHGCQIGGDVDGVGDQ